MLGVNPTHLDPATPEADSPEGILGPAFLGDEFTKSSQRVPPSPSLGRRSATAKVRTQRGRRRARGGSQRGHFKAPRVGRQGKGWTWRPTKGLAPSPQPRAQPRQLCRWRHPPRPASGSALLHASNPPCHSHLETLSLRALSLRHFWLRVVNADDQLHPDQK